MTFEELGLGAKVTSAVTQAGYTIPTPIQAEAIPHVLAKRDVLGIAQTGTGKTAAFTLPMLSILENGRARARMPRTLILEPTRELAMQVEEKFKEYGANQKLTVALLIGGVSFAEQDLKITRGVDVLIATPGRLLDHFERGKLLLTGIEVLVIDEADRMLDMGFIPDIERIVKLTPFTRQTLFFTATMVPEIQRVTEQFLTNPVVVKVDRASSTASTITQRLVASSTKDYDKREVLRKLINEAKDLKNGIIFCNRKIDVANLHKSLSRHEFSVASLHGDMDQSARMVALDAFRKNKITLLVASDVAARGLDIPDVSHVFNFDIPIHAEDYVHRIGRTGRAGREGTAYTIVDKSDAKYLEAIEKLIGKPIEWHGPNLEDYTANAPAEVEKRPRRAARELEKTKKTGKETPRNDRDRPQRSVAPERAKPQNTRPERNEQRTTRNDQQKPEQQRRFERPAKSETPRNEPRHNQTQERQHRHERDEGPKVIGFGDQLPGFLSRPVPINKG
jgi:superfamily II DNA/RNA helicase